MPARRPSSSLAAARLVAALALLGTSGACSTEIGDGCTSDAECGEGRVCDRASRAGYCTVSPCGPNSCPENSICVRFENDVTYCMGVCESHEDCRKGYTCTDDDGAPVKYCRQANRH
ncbi:hypothetical protein L6V77_02050 [Myxococcota bacterium]|nr:hypothetical protein [Myxococcota bacterium]